MLNAGQRISGRNADVITSLDALIPRNHIIRKIDRAIDWEARTAPLRSWYPKGRGRKGVDPEVLLAAMLLRQIYHIDSLRSLGAELPYNLVYRWFIGSTFTEKTPHFSTLSQNLLHRIPPDVFERCLADALCDIIDKGVLKARDLVYPSPMLTPERELPRLATKYYIIIKQMTLDEVPADTSDILSGQVEL